MKDTQEELNELVSKLEECLAANCPSWLTPNSYFVGVIPGHNLDLLQIAFDLRIDRTHMLRAQTPQALRDPSKPQLELFTERDVK